MSCCEIFRYEEYPRIKVGLIHLDRKRPWPACINPATGNQWSQDMKTKMLDILDKTGFTIFRSDEHICVDDDRSLREAVGLCRKAEVNVIVAIQPTISDGRLAPVLAQEWGPALVFMASPEEQTGEMISGNSLVGTHLMAATLRQLGRICQVVYSNLDWEKASEKLISAVHVAFATRYISKTKIGLIGHQAPGFLDFYPNPFEMSKQLGSILQHVGMTEYISTALHLISDEEVSADIDYIINNLKLPFKSLATGFGVEQSELSQSSRHYLALRRFIQENNFDSLAIRCWPELPGPQGLEQWCYMALARLATEGFPVACEGDVDGALSCLVGKLLGSGAVYLSDWLEHEDNRLTLWHGGMAPLQLSEPIGSVLGPCISRHFNNRVPGCLDATIRIGIPLTIYRLWVFNNKYHILVLEGVSIKPSRALLGNNGLVEIDGVNLETGFDRWIQIGFPHHVCVVQGKHKQRILDFARNLNITIVE
ncbi:uncharacterized protein LOC111709235 isoform X2 [Eurytemora carolleeae]|uniref:uncharacterized protein LOC111709235 isoform X1 n=1 Tax=Eurytemora carolleeae TaxID=1294199 RepID=UPI000C763D27|nr:uncharacterized protein LOC111709235 isoform X1 [Eurytemora carolleeae]XP_023338630.1 uncharacterized protein LOC111709235 isoform X2 [Eurytemora carolleeae]|eukprot:XP_023338629.1 uncharacterized protein LOC111709235 isoform X1 [Eurytemora affinis]